MAKLEATKILPAAFGRFLSFSTDGNFLKDVSDGVMHFALRSSEGNVSVVFDSPPY